MWPFKRKTEPRLHKLVRNGDLFEVFPPSYPVARIDFQSLFRACVKNEASRHCRIGKITMKG